jgi:hypothetical protein
MDREPQRVAARLDVHSPGVARDQHRPASRAIEDDREIALALGWHALLDQHALNMVPQQR